MLGYYSKKDDQVNGHAIWMKSNGKEVKVTHVLQSKDSVCGFLVRLPDLKFVGEVTKFVSDANIKVCT
jgi:hypothetical protein